MVFPSNSRAQKSVACLAGRSYSGLKARREMRGLPVGAPTTDAGPDDRLAGAALAGASILSIVAMAHHPSGAGHGALTQLVHGTMIAIVVVALAGYARLAALRGLHRFSNLVALVAYGAGAAA